MADIYDYIDNMNGKDIFGNDDDANLVKEPEPLCEYDKKIIERDKSIYEMTSFPPKRLTKELIEAYLRRALIEDERKKARTPWVKKNLSVSDLLGCVRKSYYALQNIPKKQVYIYAYGDMVGPVGSLIHNVFQNNVRCKDKEQKMWIENFGIPISGRYDMVLNTDVICEIKSVEALPDKPKPEHLKQVAIYAYLLNTFKNQHFNCIQIIYISRGKFGCCVFDIDITPRMMNSTEKMLNEYIGTLKEHLKLNVPPEMKNKYVDDTSCLFCPYEYACKKSTKFDSIG